MTKPVNPNISVPQYFAQNGPKADFTAEKLESGFSKVDPDVLAGDNLNKFIDDTYKGLNYSTAGVEDLYKGLVTYDENETYTSKSVVVDFDEAGGLKLYRSLQDDNIAHPTSEADWWQEVSLGGGAGMPVGTIFAHTCAVDFVPENSLPCDGSEYTSSQFPSLYTSWLVDGKLNTCTYEEYQSDIDTYGKCAKFGLDSTSGKFKVPTIPDGTHIQQAMSDDELGKSYNAGLPNIEGSFHPSGPNNNALMKFGASSNSFVDGAFYLGNQANCNTAQETSNSWYGGDLCFDASRSNPIYSNDVETVQTEAVALRYFVVVATGAINQSEIDWSEWATGLQGKANVDMNNLSTTGKAEVTSYAFPSSKYDVLEVGVSGETYVAPADGWFYVNSQVSGNYIIIDPIDKNNKRAISLKVNNLDMVTELQVYKGEEIALVFTGNWEPQSYQSDPFRFYYAQGVSND